MYPSMCRDMHRRTSTRVNGHWRVAFSGRQRPLTCAVWMGLTTSSMEVSDDCSAFC